MEAKSMGMLLGGLFAVAGLSYAGKRSLRFAESSESDPKFYQNRAKQIVNDIDKVFGPMIDENRSIFEQHSPHVLERYDNRQIDACDALRQCTVDTFYAGVEEKKLRGESALFEKANELAVSMDDVIEPVVLRYESDFMSMAPDRFEAFRRRRTSGCEALHKLISDLQDLQMLS